MNIQRVSDVIEPVITGLGYEFVGCDHLIQGSQALLRVYVDKPGGVNIDDCALISRQISAALDVDDPVEGRYNLEVSSPGRKRRLFNINQCPRFIGSRIAVRLRVALDGRKNFTGELQQVVENNLVLLVDGVPLSVAFSDLEKANLDPIDD